MAITIEINLFGVTIKDPTKDKSVFLFPQAWERLLEWRHQIEKSLKQQKERQWKLDEEDSDLRAHVNNYQGKCYLHIRHWYNDKPTKNGVSMLKEDWNVIKASMVENPEAALGIKVVKKLLQEAVSKIIKEKCEGCVNDWPSQNDHACLQGDDMAILYIDKAVGKVSALQFIASLAEAATEEKLIVETPHQTFKRIMQFHIKDIKKEVLKDFAF